MDFPMVVRVGRMRRLVTIAPDEWSSLLAIKVQNPAYRFSDAFFNLSPLHLERAAVAALEVGGV